MKLPVSELVAVAWLRTVPDMTASVGTTLPAVASWASTGFLQVSHAGGRPDRYTPQRASLMQIGCYAANLNGAKPPWGAANQLAEFVIANTYNGVDDLDPTQRAVTLPAGFLSAKVYTVEAVTEPRRMVDDEARIAHYTVDAIFTWAAVTS